MSKSCYWRLDLSFFLEYLFFFFEGAREGLFVKVKQLEQLLLSAAQFREVNRCCSCCRCGGQWLLWKEGGSVPCTPCSSSCHCPVPCAFSFCSPHPSSSLAQQLCSSWEPCWGRKALSCIAQCSRHFFLLLHFFFYSWYYALSRQILKCHLLWVFN